MRKLSREQEAMIEAAAKDPRRACLVADCPEPEYEPSSGPLSRFWASVCRIFNRMVAERGF